DTNALIDILAQKRNFDVDILEVVTDDANLLYTCPICVHELIYLRQKSKILMDKEWKNVSVVQRILDASIGITNITAKHLCEEERLPFVGEHHDPADRLIIAQAISDKATLVSSDKVFPKYVKHGLDLLPYKR
ncbi:MAG: PIN domain-containing protein, partial [Prevotellaceae bacterium]|nr:PIN domain-containing protein [Prevotellaceae bacterium]